MDTRASMIWNLTMVAHFRHCAQSCDPAIGRTRAADFRRMHLGSARYHLEIARDKRKRTDYYTDERVLP